MTQADTIRASLAVIEELDSAIEMTVAGMSALIPTGPRRADLDATLQHLASGFERFAKLTYIEAYRYTKHERPGGSVLKRHGHDVLGLIDALLELVEGVSDYASRPAVSEDLEFIRTDQGLRDLLGVLSHFGQRGRYSRIDGLVAGGGSDVESEPSRQWDEIELRLLMSRADWEEVIETSEAERAGAREVVGRLQRLARAIARMWTLGGLGDDGPVHYGTLAVLLGVRDEQLGLVAPNR
jgi:hypothetical protein